MKRLGIIIAIVLSFSIGVVILFMDKIKSLFQKDSAVQEPVTTASSMPVYYTPSSSSIVNTVSEEKTVGGTQSAYPITSSMNFDNIDIFKTSLGGTIEITLDNGFVKILSQQNESWQHSAATNKYFNITVVVTDGATYEYSGALI